MKLKRCIPLLMAALLLLAAVSVTSAGAVEPKTVTSGAVVEEILDNETRVTECGSPEEAWVKAINIADNTKEVVITLGTNWIEDTELIVGASMHITLDLNGHYVHRTRDHQMKRNGYVFKVEENAIFTVRDSNPKGAGYRGVKGGVITGGASSNTGGGVHIEEKGEFRLQGGTIYDCRTDEDGGGVYLAGSSMDTKFTMTGGRIYGCKTMESADNCCGGGVYLVKGTVNISNAKIDDCYSEDDGGAIYSCRGTINLDNVIFSGNYAHEQGGVIYTGHDIAKYQATVINAQNCIFAANHADQDGGAIFINDNPDHNQAVLFHNCAFRSNSANEQGGAFYINDDNVALSSCEIVSNTSAQEGGGVYVDGRYNITVMGLTKIMDNSSHSEAKGVDNLALNNYTLGKAYIINAGLYKGSEIHFGSTSSDSVKVSEWVSNYQQQYFKADNGYLTSQDSRSVNTTMVTSGSVFSNGGFYAVVIIGVAGIIGTIALVIHQKKKNKLKEGGEESDSNEGT